MISGLPLLNACLNCAAAVFLVSGWLFIRRKRVAAHKFCMLSAFACSSFFLASYLYYHAHAGIIRFRGLGWIRPVYFSILTTHTVLAAAIVPLILRTLYLALKGRFERHRAWARWTFPLWLYVSVTGVVVYRLLFPR